MLAVMGVKKENPIHLTQGYLLQWSLALNPISRDETLIGCCWPRADDLTSILLGRVKACGLLWERSNFYEGKCYHSGLQCG